MRPCLALPAAETHLSTGVQREEIAACSRLLSRSGSLGFSGQDVSPLQTSGFLDLRWEWLLCPPCLIAVYPFLLKGTITSFLGPEEKRWSSLTAAAAAAKSLQSCPTLCDPIDGSPPGSPVPGIFPARVLEWGAIAFSALAASGFPSKRLPPPHLTPAPLCPLHPLLALSGCRSLANAAATSPEELVVKRWQLSGNSFVY